MRRLLGILLAIPAACLAADPSPPWTMKSTGRICAINTHARSAGDDSLMLFIQWSADKSYEMYAWGKPFDGALVIDAVDSTDTFRISPANLAHLLSGAEVETVLGNLALGKQLRLTKEPTSGQSQAFATLASNARQASSALGACVETLKRQPVPDVSEVRGVFMATGSPSSCVVARYWRNAEAAFEIRVVAEAQRAAVEFSRVLSTHTDAPTEPFSVDARNFHGAVQSSMRTVRIELNPEQVAGIEKDLLGGKGRSFDLTLPGFGTETLIFGAPSTRAGAAMFGACRRELDPSATDDQ